MRDAIVSISGNQEKVSSINQDDTILYVAAGDEAGGPAELERVAARRTVDVENIAREIEILDLERAHRACIHFGKRHAAVGDDCSVESHES